MKKLKYNISKQLKETLKIILLSLTIAMMTKFAIAETNTGYSNYDNCKH